MMKIWGKRQCKGLGAGSLSFWEALQGFELVAPAFDVVEEQKGVS